MTGTYEGDGRTVFAYFGTPQIERRDTKDKQLNNEPDNTITERRLNEIESLLCDGAFVGRHENEAVRLAAACRETVRLATSNPLFVRRLQSVAARLTRAASAIPTQE
ncbi:MAG: hypothetical protein KDB68_10945 [Planctomycetes bacterium]|nr:hypothetical protein [Planctomycetota bacterium]